MQAREAKLLDILSAVSQFIIPIYQRTYSWTRKECQQLWADIIRAGFTDEIGVHFIGYVVYIEEGQATITVKAPKLVIDGQQRLTTVTLQLSALAHVLSELPEDQEEPFDGFSPAKIRQYYLTNSLENKEKRFKLPLSDTDRATLMAVVDPNVTEPPPEPSIRIQENHDFFLEQLRDSSTDLAVVCRGISKLLVVDVALSRDQDNPQLIFESMNSTGRELSQVDLIRNNVLMGQPAFGQEAYSGNEFSAFMRDVLTLKTAEVPRQDLVYAVFKQDERQPAVAEAGIEAIPRDLHTTAIRYCRVALGQEPDPQIDEEFQREMRIRSLYKFNKSCSDWLRRLDNHQRKEPIVVAEDTIEHILPRNPVLPSTWREALGPEWAAIQEEWIDRLGNLTLTGYNSKLSDRPLGQW